MQNDSNDESIKEETNYYTVTFDSNGGTNIDSVVIKENDVIIEPSIPQKEGYIFEYWELDGKQYDFNTKVTSEVTLIAKWQEVEEEVVETIEESKTNSTIIYVVIGFISCLIIILIIRKILKNK